MGSVDGGVFRVAAGLKPVGQRQMAPGRLQRGFVDEPAVDGDRAHRRGVLETGRALDQRLQRQAQRLIGSAAQLQLAQQVVEGDEVFGAVDLRHDDGVDRQACSASRSSRHQGAVKAVDAHAELAARIARRSRIGQRAAQHCAPRLSRRARSRLRGRAPANRTRAPALDWPGWQSSWEGV
jgi:hypothetical protein